jgi:hypothetical protein
MGEKFSMLSTENLEKIDMENNTNNLDETTKGFLKGVATTCRSMGHTEEAAKYARRCMFAMLDRFGLNSLFVTTSPDDECSFRVRLYSKPQNWVSSCKIKTKTLNSKLELYVYFHINILLDALYSKLELYVDFCVNFLLNAYLLVFLPLYVLA